MDFTVKMGARPGFIFPKLEDEEIHDVFGNKHD